MIRNMQIFVYKRNNLLQFNSRLKIFYAVTQVFPATITPTFKNACRCMFEDRKFCIHLYGNLKSHTQHRVSQQSNTRLRPLSTITMGHRNGQLFTDIKYYVNL